MAAGVYPMCPQHPWSKVVRDGFYGRSAPGYFRRQRFRCYPVARRKKPFHRFTEALPRRHLPHPDECAVCERERESWEGPRLPRRQQYTIAEISEALLSVAQGHSYRSTAYSLRSSLGRPPGSRQQSSRSSWTRPVWGHSSQPHLVSDWVEVYGPVLTAARRETTWPEVLALDEFSYRKSKRGVGVGSLPCFSVLCAYGYEGKGKPGRLWLAESFAQHTAVEWLQFLSSLPGTPRLILCDGSPTIRLAVSQRWPGPGIPPVWPGETRRPKVRMSHFHLVKTLQATLGVLREDYETARRALATAEDWASFQRLMGPTDKKPRAWIRRHQRYMHLLFLVRGGNARGARDPASTGALENAGNTLKARLLRGKNSFTNKRRTDRLLALLREDINGNANLSRFHRDLTRSLKTRQGRPAQEQRLIRDPKSSPTLR